MPSRSPPTPGTRPHQTIVSVLPSCDSVAMACKALFRKSIVGQSSPASLRWRVYHAEVRKKFLPPDSDHVKRQMQSQKTRDTAPEVALKKALHSEGLRFRLQRRVLTDVNRRHDIVFVGAKVVVDVHGCFWHGCPAHFVPPKRNQLAWEAKIATNRERDADTSKRLKASGWTHFEVWEHEDTAKAAQRIKEAVNAGNK